MAKRRSKSINDIARQAGRLSGNIAARRARNRQRGGSYGDITDTMLRQRELRVLRTATKYEDNIASKQRRTRNSYNSYTNESGQNDRKYSQRVYMGLSNG